MNDPLSNPAIAKALFPPFVGGLGFDLVPVAVDTAQPAVAANVAPQAQLPTTRPFFPGAAFRGQWPGFGPFPMLTLFYRWAMRRYPMVVKVHKRVTAPVMSGTRSIEIVDDGGNPDLAARIREAATADLLPALAKAMPGAMEAPCFGQWLQEIVWDRRDDRLAPIDVQSILPTEGVIQVDQYRRFAGYRVAGNYRDARYGFLCVHDRHIDPILGYSCNEAALVSFFRATKSAENADALERKASGIQILFQLMEGVEIEDEHGKPVDHRELMTRIMNAAAQGQSALLPGMAFDKDAIEAHPELAKVPMVNAQPLDWGNTGPALEAHLARKRELDVEICSAWGVPERAVMEAANHGGYSDAVPAGDVVLNISEQLHANACTQWDEQITPRWMAANFGQTRVKIRTAPAPLADPQQVFLQGLVTTLAQASTADPEIASNIDKRKLLERVEVPLVSADDAAKNLVVLQARRDAAAQAIAAASPKLPPVARKVQALGRQKGKHARAA